MHLVMNHESCISRGIWTLFIYRPTDLNGLCHRRSIFKQISIIAEFTKQMAARQSPPLSPVCMAASMYDSIKQTPVYETAEMIEYIRYCPTLQRYMSEDNYVEGSSACPQVIKEVSYCSS